MSNRRVALILSAALAIVPVPAMAAGSATDAVAPASTEDAARPFAMNLARPGDFVPQTNFVQCVGASMQIMINMIRPGTDRTAKTQLRLQNLARKWSGPTPSGRIRNGASVTGWTAGLSLRGVGPYRLLGETSLQGALKAAAKAIRTTRKPVGLLMWRGRHAWVMSGFRSTADPARTDRFTVTGVYVLDPLYPYGSSVWGPSPRPGELLTPRELGRQYLPRRKRSAWSAINPTMARLNGKYVLVLPVMRQPIEVWAPRFL